MTEAEFEKLLDAAVMRRLNTDLAYKNAETEYEARRREEEIDEEEYVRLSHKYKFYGYKLI